MVLFKDSKMFLFLNVEHTNILDIEYIEYCGKTWPVTEKCSSVNWTYMLYSQKFWDIPNWIQVSYLQVYVLSTSTNSWECPGGRDSVSFIALKLSYLG